MTTELRKYTSIYRLFSILLLNCVTLIDPAFWEDKNEIATISKYKEVCNYKTVLAMCLAKAPEMYLLWKAYAGNKLGVCIIFDEYELKNTIKTFNHNIIFKPVEYVKYKDISSSPIEAINLPLIKRWPYIGEEEYRIIYTSKTETLKEMNIPISRRCIKRIKVNPWISEQEFILIKKIINNFLGWENLEVSTSTVLYFDGWAKRIEKRDFLC
jgi:hypothetical protein